LDFLNAVTCEPFELERATFTDGSHSRQESTEYRKIMQRENSRWLQATILDFENALTVELFELRRANLNDKIPCQLAALPLLLLATLRRCLVKIAQVLSELWPKTFWIVFEKECGDFHFFICVFQVPWQFRRHQQFCFCFIILN